MGRPQTPEPDEPDEPDVLDAEAWDLPRRMTRLEGALAAGPDWRWTRPHFEKDEHDE